MDGSDIIWECPTSATKGWKSRAIQQLQQSAIKHHRHLDPCHCLEVNGFAAQKSCPLATTCREVWFGLQRRCPGRLILLPCRLKAVTKAIAVSWQRVEEKART